MSLWPPSLSLFDPRFVISSFGGTWGGTVSCGSLSTPGSAAWPAANRAIYVPFRIANPVTVVKVWWVNGTTAASNVDIGVFTIDGAQISAISTGGGGGAGAAQSGTSVIQMYDITDFTFGPGVFYMGASMDGTSHMFRGATGIQVLKVLGCAQQATAYVLPTAATLATVASAYLPLFGLSCRATV